MRSRTAKRILCAPTRPSRDAVTSATPGVRCGQCGCVAVDAPGMRFFFGGEGGGEGKGLKILLGGW